jgi:hypothetical protein
MVRKSGKKVRQPATDVAFVQAWLQSENYAGVARLLGLARGSVLAKATRLRKAGVNLPKYARSRKPIDVAGLNELIARAKKSKRS